jgi:phage-related minor tail protein
MLQLLQSLRKDMTTVTKGMEDLKKQISWVSNDQAEKHTELREAQRTTSTDLVWLADMGMELY